MKKLFWILPVFLLVVFAWRAVSANEGPASPAAQEKPAWGRAPFTQVNLSTEADTVRSGELTDLSLTGIMLRGNRKVAILDHLFVREGDSIQDAQILRIEKDRVVLKRDSKEITLRMGSA